MYEKIVEHISEIKVVEGMQSLASTYCMELMMKTPVYLESNLDNLLHFDLRKCHTDQKVFMQLYEHQKFNQVEFFKKTLVQHVNFKCHLIMSVGQIYYRLVQKEDESEILGVISIVNIDKNSYNLRYYFQMSVSVQEVQNSLNEVEEELLTIIDQANIKMIIEAVRLNFELPSEIKLVAQRKNSSHTHANTNVHTNINTHTQNLSNHQPVNFKFVSSIFFLIF